MLKLWNEQNNNGGTYFENRAGSTAWTWKKKREHSLCVQIDWQISGIPEVGREHNVSHWTSEGGRAGNPGPALLLKGCASSKGVVGCWSQKTFNIFQGSQKTTMPSPTNGRGWSGEESLGRAGGLLHHQRPSLTVVTMAALRLWFQFAQLLFVLSRSLETSESL